MVAALAPDMMARAMPVYDMAPAESLEKEAVTALADGTLSAVILMSARSARLFREQLCIHGLEGRIRGLTLIAGSAAIAEAAGAGWRRSSRPAARRGHALAIACLFYHRMAARRQHAGAAEGKGLTTE